MWRKSCVTKSHYFIIRAMEKSQISCWSAITRPEKTLVTQKCYNCRAQHEQVSTYSQISSCRTTTRTLKKQLKPFRLQSVLRGLWASVIDQHSPSSEHDENGILCCYTHMSPAEWADCMCALRQQCSVSWGLRSHVVRGQATQGAPLFVGWSYRNLTHENVDTLE